jgi:hypothetical protein
VGEVGDGNKVRRVEEPNLVILNLIARDDDDVVRSRGERDRDVNTLITWGDEGIGT